MTSKELYKVMWVGRAEPFIWNIYNEEPASDMVISCVKNNINCEAWLEKFSSDFSAWLNLDDDSVYNLNIEEYSDFLHFIKKFNNDNSVGITLFYWYDIDRSEDSTFEWSKCVLCGEKLVEIEGAHYLNKKACLNDFIVYPETVEP